MIDPAIKNDRQGLAYLDDDYSSPKIMTVTLGANELVRDCSQDGSIYESTPVDVSSIDAEFLLCCEQLLRANANSLKIGFDVNTDIEGLLAHYACD